MAKVIVVRKGEKVKTVTLGGAKINLVLRTTKIEALLSTLKPGASFGQPYKHVGQEIHLMLKGETEFEVAGKKYLLKKGDILWYPSIVPHTARNLGKEKASYFSVVSPPTFM